MGPNLETMRIRAAEICKAPPECIEWFQYGATYVMSLIAMASFYDGAGRDEEADEITTMLRQQCGASKDADLIAKNLLRLGIFWDEKAELVAAASCTNLSPEQLLDIVRNTKKEGSDD